MLLESTLDISALLTQSDLTYITVTHHLKPETAERFDQVIRLGMI